MTAAREARKSAPALTRWAVLFRDAPAMMDIRADKARRDAHVAYVEDHPELRIGGGLKPDTDGAPVTCQRKRPVSASRTQPRLSRVIR